MWPNCTCISLVPLASNRKCFFFFFFNLIVFKKPLSWSLSFLNHHKKISICCYFFNFHQFFSLFSTKSFFANCTSIDNSIHTKWGTEKCWRTIVKRSKECLKKIKIYRRTFFEQVLSIFFASAPYKCVIVPNSKNMTLWSDLMLNIELRVIIGLLLFFFTDVDVPSSNCVNDNFFSLLFYMSSRCAVYFSGFPFVFLDFAKIFRFQKKKQGP